MKTLRIVRLGIVGVGIAGLGIALFAATVHAQAPKPTAHPDFSGTWVFDEPATGAAATVARKGLNIFGESFVAKQDTKTLTFEITVAKGVAPVQAVYALDGTATNNVSPPQTPGAPPIIVTATAKWIGSKLVIKSKSQQPGGRANAPTVVNVVSTRTIWFDKQGRLVIDRDGTPKQVVASTRSVYKKQ